MSKRAIDEVDVNNSDDDLYNTNEQNDAPVTKKAKLDNTTAQEDKPQNEESGSEEEYTDDSDDDVIFNFGNNSSSFSSNKIGKNNTNNNNDLKLQSGETNADEVSNKKINTEGYIFEGSEGNELEKTAGEGGEEEEEEEVSSDEEVSGNNNFLIEDESIPFFITSKTGQPIDIKQDVEFDGINMDELDPNFLKEKPWRSSRAKLEHYFNYGFNEATWIEYLHRQTRFNAKYNGAKLLYQLMLLQNQGKLEQKQIVPEVAKLKNLIKYQQKQQQREPPLPTVQPIINAQGTIINPNAVKNNNNDMPTGNNNTGAPMFPFPPFNMMQMGNNNRK